MAKQIRIIRVHILFSFTIIANKKSKYELKVTNCQSALLSPRSYKISGRFVFDLDSRNNDDMNKQKTKSYPIFYDILSVPITLCNHHHHQKCLCFIALCSIKTLLKIRSLSHIVTGAYLWPLGCCQFDV